MTRQMFRTHICQVRFCRHSRQFDLFRFDEILHVQVLHFDVSCTLGQTLSLCQCSCRLGDTSQIDLGLHAEIVQNCFHVQSVCASCSKRAELALSAALSVRVLQLCVHSNGEPIDPHEHWCCRFHRLRVSGPVCIVATSSVFRGLSCTVRNSHSSLCPSVYRSHCFTSCTSSSDGPASCLDKFFTTYAISGALNCSFPTPARYLERSFAPSVL